MLKNITLSAEELLIEKAREKARTEKKSLNKVFREWLKRYAGQDQSSKDFKRFMKKFDYVEPGRTFTRDEMNER